MCEIWARLIWSHSTLRSIAPLLLVGAIAAEIS
jgi:hypothetical protein